MTLRQLLIRHTWLNIEVALLQEYVISRKQLANYESVYHSLLLLEEEDTDLQIHLQVQSGNTKQQDVAVEVIGRRRIPHITEAHLILPYNLHFTPWAQWLAMPVSLRSLAQFTETEIVAHCLVEMTRQGFNEATIQLQARHLCRVMDEMTKAGMLHL